MSNWTKSLTYIIGIVMTIAMVASLIMPLLTQGTQTQVQPAEQPTATPAPTLPAPPDTSQISFDATYLHPSGLYTVGVPTGWEPAVEDTSENEARASFFNPSALSVIETRVLEDETEIATGSELSAFFSDTWLGQTWRDYSSWEETNRQITDDEHVVIDFNLSRSNSNYIARQESWAQDGEIFSVRVVTPENAPTELKFLLDGVINNLQTIDVNQSAPRGWVSYFDNTDKHMILFPQEWTVTDADDGLPATIIGDDITVLVETVDVELDSEDAATDWVENWRSGVSTGSVEAIEVDGASGYKVAYTLETLDGEPESGLVILLNGPDNRLHVANARVSGTDVDLATDDSGAFDAVLNALNSFRLFPDLNISALQEDSGFIAQPPTSG